MDANNVSSVFPIIITSVSSILVALIAAISLIKVNTIDNQDKIRRFLWTAEVYAMALGKCIENPCDKNREEYRSYYLLCMLYSDKELKKILVKIDRLLEKKKMNEVKVEAILFTELFEKKYRMKKYRPRIRIDQQ